MTRRILSALFLTFWILQITPAAQAVDIPTLTWERGKEQNVVVGGISSPNYLEVKLLKPGAPQIKLRPSSINSSGYQVYAATLPADLPVGEYAIFVFGDGSVNGSKVAKVNISAMKRYDITLIPLDLLFLILSIIFTFTALSVIHGARYLNFSFLRQKTLIESQSLLFSNSVPRIVYPAYLLRAGALTKMRPSIFKYLLLKDETLIHKVSPLLWSVLPAIGLGLGLQGGLVSKITSAFIPLYSLIAISVVGFFDSYSGIFALLGFAIGQIVLGEVLDFRSIFSLATLALSWVFVGYIYELLISSKGLEQLRKSHGLQPWSSKWFSLVIISSITGFLYFSTLLLTQSITTEPKINFDNYLISALVIVFCSGFKFTLQLFLDFKLTNLESADNFVSQEFNPQSLFTFLSSCLIGLFAFFSAFIWTSNLGFSLIVSFIMLGTCLTFSASPKFPKIQKFRKFRRNLIIEAAAVTYLGYLLFILIRSLPIDFSLKSEFFVICALSLPFLHQLFTAFLPDFNRRAEQPQ